MSPLLLDTCALIFVTIAEPQASKAKTAMVEAYAANEPVFISPISAWEIGLLVARGRLNLSMSPDRWFESVMQRHGIRLALMTPEVLIASSFLPDLALRDPADRIIAATAREYGFTVVTRDKPLLAYAQKGHIRALVC